MESPAATLARELARNADAVCRHYLANGRRSGRYWLVGDVDNTSGSSLFVRLIGPTSGPGAAGKWQDAATGEHGDRLDLIAATRRLSSLAEALAEARAFLRSPQPLPQPCTPRTVRSSSEAARRLWASAMPIRGTLAETYLRKRGLAIDDSLKALRFHPRCYWVSTDGQERRTIPAMLAAVTDDAGLLTGLHRTWLSPGGFKANIDPPRRAMGALLGNSVRLGKVASVAIIAEGLETALSLRTMLPEIPALAALSAAHLERINLPASIRHIYISQDNDLAGRSATERLKTRAEQSGVGATILSPHLSDWNDDLRRFGYAHCKARVQRFLHGDTTS